VRNNIMADAAPVEQKEAKKSLNIEKNKGIKF
jgi:hypothetical protein